MLTSGSRTRILIVDDHHVFRASVAQALAVEGDLEVAGHCGAVSEAVEILAREPVDVVLLDYDLVLERGSRFFAAAQQAGFPGRVLIVSAWLSDAEARHLIRLGAAGIFLKRGSLAELAEAVRTVARGGSWLDQHYLRLAAETDGQAGQRDSLGQLSGRERVVLRCLLEGLSNKEIGSQLGITEGAVKALLQRLFHKTGAGTRSQLVRVALEQYGQELGMGRL